MLRVQIWGTGLQGGARAAVLLNRHFDEALGYDNSSITLHWHHLGWEADMPVRPPAPDSSLLSTASPGPQSPASRCLCSCDHSFPLQGADPWG